MIDFLLHPRLRSVLLFVVTFLFGGTLLFSYLEGWTLIDSFYFTVATMMTTGTGQHLTPSNDVSKIAASLFMLLTIPLILITIGMVTDVIRQERKPHPIKRIKKRVLAK